MKATVRFDDVFEGEDLPDIYRQVLEYLQEVVLSGDLEAFDIDCPQWWEVPGGRPTSVKDRH